MSLIKYFFPYRIYYFLLALYYKTKYYNHNLKFETMVQILNVKFGKNITLYKYSVLKNSTIDDFSYVAKFSYINLTKIGKFCSIGSNVKSGVGIHPSTNFVSSHPIFYSNRGQSAGIIFHTKSIFEEFKPTYIGNDVWIGDNVLIIPGVRIGDGAIIAAGSVVTKDVQPYSIVAGIPANIIKFRFTQNQINFLLEFKWWDKELEWLRENKMDFINIEDFLKKFEIN